MFGKTGKLDAIICIAGEAKWAGRRVTKMGVQSACRMSGVKLALREKKLETSPLFLDLKAISSPTTIRGEIKFNQ